MRPAPAIAWTIAGALTTAVALESLPARGPAPMPLQHLVEHAATWLAALFDGIVRFMQHARALLG